MKSKVFNLLLEELMISNLNHLTDQGISGTAFTNVLDDILKRVKKYEKNFAKEIEVDDGEKVEMNVEDLIRKRLDTVMHS